LPAAANEKVQHALTKDPVFFFLRSSRKRNFFVGLDYQGKDIVFKLIIEYNSLRDFGP
jgi:hypothetical protein